MFWKHREGEEKLPGPKDIPQPMGTYLVTEMNKNPDWVWGLKGVIRKVGKTGFYCRVFDEAETAKARLKVKNWTSLDNHPELIVFEGYCDNYTRQVRPEKFVKA